MEHISLELVEKVVIAQKFDISTWPVPCLNAIAQRNENDELVGSQPVGYGLGFEVSKSDREGSHAAVPPLHTLQLYGIRSVQ